MSDDAIRDDYEETYDPRERPDLVGAVEFEEPEPEAEEVDLDDLLGEDGEPEPEFLVPLRPIPADTMPYVVGEVLDEDGNVVVEGETYYLQKGRTIEVLPVTTFGTMFSTAGLLLHSRKGNTIGLVQSMGELCERLSEVVAKWDLIGPDGTPKPQPYKNSDAIVALTEDELAWLVDKVSSKETAKGRKKGSRRSGSTTTARQVRRRK